MRYIQIELMKSATLHHHGWIHFENIIFFLRRVLTICVMHEIQSIKCITDHCNMWSSSSRHSAVYVAFSATEN